MTALSSLKTCTLCNEKISPEDQFETFSCCQKYCHTDCLDKHANSIITKVVEKGEELFTEIKHLACIATFEKNQKISAEKIEKICQVNKNDYISAKTTA